MVPSHKMYMLHLTAEIEAFHFLYLHKSRHKRRQAFSSQPTACECHIMVAEVTGLAILTLYRCSAALYRLG